MKTLGCVVVMLLAFAIPVRAQVYSGCSVPSATSRHAWYINPVNGKSPAAGGNGSQASPWNSLAGVISGQWGTQGFAVTGYTRPLLSSVPYFHLANGAFVDVADQLGNPPVQPGDTIYLMSGNYGDIVLGNYNLSTTNSDFVTVEAGPTPGQVPVFSSLYIDRTSKWVFNGIKVQSLLGANGNVNRAYLDHRPGPVLPDHRHRPGEPPHQLGRQHGWLDPGAVGRAGPQRLPGRRVWPATARTVSPTQAASRWPDRTSRMCVSARSSPATTCW